MPGDEAKRRNRTQKSCQPCRIGKLRCDRELPCSECVKRLREPSCVYAQQVQDSLAYRSQAKQMRQKLENLEKVVKSLRAGDATAASPRVVGSQRPIKTPTGTLRITHDEETFVGDTHWESIVNDIAEVKAHFDDHPDVLDSPHSPLIDGSSPDSDTTATPDFFIGGHTKITMQDLVASLPPKAQCDRIISAWFRSMDNYKHILHVPTFQRQYAHFWKDSAAATPIWLALLYNILALGAVYLTRSASLDDPSHPGGRLHSLGAHAILLADYAKPKMYLLESLVLYIRYGQMQGDGTQLKQWLTMGLVTRLATRMGIFRDAQLSDGVLPFFAEMRRRLWQCICYMDVIYSYHIGLVSIIQGLPANTAPPSNIDDSEFGPDSMQLPPSRPLEERTNVTYAIILGELTGVFAETVTASNALIPPSDIEVAALHEKTQKISNAMPDTFKMRPLDESFGDPPELIMERIRLHLVATKNVCVLYRRYLGGDNFVNRRRCMDSALDMLSIHILIDEATQPTGQLENCHYQDIHHCMDCFILPGIIAGVELSDAHRRAKTGAAQCYSPDQLQRMRDMLRSSCDVWIRWTFAPRKARRVAFAMKQMLDEHSAYNRNETGNTFYTIPNSTGPTAQVQQESALLFDTSSDSLMETMDGPGMSSFPDIFSTSWEDQGMNWGKWDSIMNTGEVQEPVPQLVQPGNFSFA